MLLSVVAQALTADNDNFADRITVPPAVSAVVEVIGCTVGATVEPFEPLLREFGSSIWYAYVPRHSGVLYVNLLAAVGFEPQLDVFANPNNTLARISPATYISGSRSWGAFIACPPELSLASESCPNAYRVESGAAYVIQVDSYLYSHGGYGGNDDYGTDYSDYNAISEYEPVVLNALQCGSCCFRLAKPRRLQLL